MQYNEDDPLTNLREEKGREAWRPAIQEPASASAKVYGGRNG